MKITKLTWLGFLNFIILQWFCVRLAIKYEKIEKTEVLEGDKEITYYKEESRGFIWILGVAPLTGWWNEYIYIFK